MPEDQDPFPPEVIPGIPYTLGTVVLLGNGEDNLPPHDPMLNEAEQLVDTALAAELVVEDAGSGRLG